MGVELSVPEMKSGSIVRTEVGERRLLVRGIAVGYRGKAFEKDRFRPMYAGANMGHPSSTVDRGCVGNSAGGRPELPVF